MKETVTLLCKAAELKSNDTGHITGYASVFNGLDCYSDTIEPQAYADVLKAGTLPRMFFNHDRYSVPIGKWQKWEADSKGLHVEGALNLNTSQGRDVYEAVKFGTVDGLSVALALDESCCSYENAEDIKGCVRHIKKVLDVPEISVVTYPADSKARIADVKSAIDSIKTISDFEKFLREAGSFSRSEAVAVIATAKKVINSQSESVKDDDLLKIALQVKALNLNLWR